MLILSILFACTTPTPTPEAQVPATPCVDAIVTDIDETLTLSDAEFFDQLDDPSNEPEARPEAATLMQGYADLGFRVIYVSTRGRNMDMGDGTTALEATDRWLTENGFPRNPDDMFLSRGDNFTQGDNAVDLKAGVIRDHQVMDWVFTYAYGNAATDVEAFLDAGIPEDRIWFVGDRASDFDLVRIPGDEAFQDHLPILDSVVPACE